MRYVLRMLGKSEEVGIDASLFAEIKAAQNALVRMIGVEQKFDLLIENYSDYERELLELSLHQALRVDLDWASFQNDIAAVSRRLANLLSAARLYIDQIQHDISSACGDEAAASLKQKSSEQYDERLGYRVMEALRNVIQHQSIPVHGIGYPREAVERKVRYRAIPTFDIARLEDTKMKRSVLNELRTKGETHELTPIIRDYIEGLGQVHHAFRTLTAGRVTEWDRILADHQLLASGGNGNAIVLASARDEHGEDIDTVHLFSDLTSYRKEFERRNRTPTRFVGRFVSSES